MSPFTRSYLRIFFKLRSHTWWGSRGHLASLLQIPVPRTPNHRPNLEMSRKRVLKMWLRSGFGAFLLCLITRIWSRRLSHIPATITLHKWFNHKHTLSHALPTLTWDYIRRQPTLQKVKPHRCFAASGISGHASIVGKCRGKPLGLLGAERRLRCLKPWYKLLSDFGAVLQGERGGLRCDVTTAWSMGVLYALSNITTRFHRRNHNNRGNQKSATNVGCG